MTVAGIIAEYNPFHNGHRHHILETRRLTGCDFVIAAMDGSFTQRGEAALLDKWTRARMALLCGADLVIELPALFAVRSADWFARGGVGLLGALGVVDVLSFGCEIPDFDLLSRAVAILDAETEEFQTALRKKLGEGQSHARARGEALREQAGVDLRDMPNASLAVEYLRANRRLARPMEMLPIQRTGAYHDLALHPHASAGAIRNALLGGDLSAACLAMPQQAAELMRAAWPNGAAMPSAMDDLVLYALRRTSAEDLARLPDVSEGLDRKLYKAGREAAGRDELLAAMKSKRYPYARLSRLLAHALLGFDRELARRYPAPPYARVLGFRKEATGLLRAIGGRGGVPLVTDPVKLKGDPCFELETRATDIRGLMTKEGALRRAGRDFREKMIVVE